MSRRRARRRGGDRRTAPERVAAADSSRAAPRSRSGLGRAGGTSPPPDPDRLRRDPRHVRRRHGRCHHADHARGPRLRTGRPACHRAAARRCRRGGRHSGRADPRLRHRARPLHVDRRARPRDPLPAGAMARARTRAAGCAAARTGVPRPLPTLAPGGLVADAVAAGVGRRAEHPDQVRGLAPVRGRPAGMARGSGDPPPRLPHARHGVLRRGRDPAADCPGDRRPRRGTAGGRRAGRRSCTARRAAGSCPRRAVRRPGRRPSPGRSDRSSWRHRNRARCARGRASAVDPATARRPAVQCQDRRPSRRWNPPGQRGLHPGLHHRARRALLGECDERTTARRIAAEMADMPAPADVVPELAERALRR